MVSTGQAPAMSCSALKTEILDYFAVSGENSAQLMTEQINLCCILILNCLVFWSCGTTVLLFLVFSLYIV